MSTRKSYRGWIILLLVAATAAAAFYFRPIRQPISIEAVHRPIVAVLIFDNLNGQPELDFLANAFTRATTAAIREIYSRDVDVIGHRSIVTYRNSRKTLHQIGRELGVDYLLEG